MINRTYRNFQCGCDLLQNSLIDVAILSKVVIEEASSDSKLRSDI